MLASVRAILYREFRAIRMSMSFVKGPQWLPMSLFFNVTALFNRRSLPIGL